MVDYTKEKLLEIFREEAVRIWGDTPELRSIALAVDFDEQYKLAALETHFNIFGERTKTRHGKLIVPPVMCILLLTQRCLDLPYEKFIRVVRHEVIHIGYARHDKAFYRMCDKFDAAKSIGDATGEYKVQEKQHGKFVTIETHDALDKATTAAWVHSISGKRVRVSA